MGLELLFVAKPQLAASAGVAAFVGADKIASNTTVATANTVVGLRVARPWLWQLRVPVDGPTTPSCPHDCSYRERAGCVALVVVVLACFCFGRGLWVPRLETPWWWDVEQPRKAPGGSFVPSVSWKQRELPLDYLAFLDDDDVVA